MRINVALRDPGGGATGGNDDAQDAPADDVTDAVDEHPTEPDAVTGINPLQSRLWAQVRKGEPAMTTDADGRLRHRNWPDSHGILFLGDVCEALLRCFGAYEPPQVSEQPRLDQQRWTIVITDGVLEVTVRSRSYWGWGLFNRCFLNEIVIEGPLPVRARCVHDIVATLGRNPWEASRVKAFEKATSGTMSSHTSSWEGLVSLAKEGMYEEITQLQDAVRSLTGVSGDAAELLDAAEQALDEARSALSDKNAPAVERALSRASNAIIQADPSTEVRSADQTLMGD